MEYVRVLRAEYIRFIAKLSQSKNLQDPLEKCLHILDLGFLELDGQNSWSSINCTQIEQIKNSESVKINKNLKI